MKVKLRSFEWGGEKCAVSSAAAGSASDGSLMLSGAVRLRPISKPTGTKQGLEMAIESLPTSPDLDPVMPAASLPLDFLGMGNIPFPFYD